MAYHFEFDSEHKILLVVHEGEVQRREIEEINFDTGKHVARLKPAAGVVDLSAIKTFNVPSHTMRVAASQPSPYPAETPRFIVAPADYLFGMARMYEITANRPMGKLRVVHSREEVFSALGVEDPKFERLA